MDRTSPKTRDSALERPTPIEAPDEGARTIFALARASGPEASICPGEAARARAAGRGQAEAWRPHLAETRRAGVHLAAKGQIDMLRKGEPIAADAIRGIVRFRLKPERGSS